jgi:vacuolar-type H+-ATPase subunit E/Vma4
MPLNKLCQKIEEEAKNEADAILSAAKSEAEKIKASYESKKSEYEAKINAKASQLAEERRRNIITNSRINARNNELLKKQNILDEVFKKCYSELEKLDKNKYSDFIQKLIIDSGMKKLEIIPGKKDKEVFGSNFIKGMKEKNLEITVSSKTADFDKGFIAKSGEMEMDFSLLSVLENKKPELTVAINSILFGNS